jgi:MFS family permease
MSGAFRTLHYRNYRLYFSGQGVSLIGTWIQLIALNWLVYELTNSALMLGLVGFVNRIPAFILAPFAGVVIDRLNKFKLLLWTQILSMLQAGLLAVLVLTHTIQVWHILLLGGMLGVINSVDTPVRQSFVVEMIGKKEDLSNAIALNSILINIARLLGPTIAGILVALVGAGWCFSINAISYIAIIASLLMMEVAPREIKRSAAAPLTDLREGFRYVKNFIPIRNLLLLLALISLMGMPYQVLMPVFAKDIFKGGSHTLGFLMSAVGIGALAGGFYLASRKTVVGYGKKIIFATSLFGLTLAIFSQLTYLPLALVVLLFTGLGMMMQMTSINTVIQTLVDDDKRGRTMSFHTMAFFGMVPFGNLLSGVLADAIGVRSTVLFGGLCCVLAAIYASFRLPEMRALAKPIYIHKHILPDDEM